MIKLIRTAAFLLSTAVATPTTAQDYDKGALAYQAGDYETALQEWRPLAEQGNAQAQVKLGVMYVYGNGVPQDYTEAVNWVRLAAEQGNAEAQFYLGYMYTDGEGVIQDYAEAVNWFRLAAEQGNAEARDDLIRLASEQGNAPAQYALGSMSADGDGVIQDTFIAHMWFNISAANGHELGSAGRSLIEQRMTLEQIAEAQALARRCMASNYQDCG
jgi:TPR repeat protein